MGPTLKDIAYDSGRMQYLSSGPFGCPAGQVLDGGAPKTLRAP